MLKCIVCSVLCIIIIIYAHTAYSYCKLQHTFYVLSSCYYTETEFVQYITGFNTSVHYLHKRHEINIYNKIPCLVNDFFWHLVNFNLGNNEIVV
jgi:hypothetical protein